MLGFSFTNCNRDKFLLHFNLSKFLSAEIFLLQVIKIFKSLEIEKNPTQCMSITFMTHQSLNNFVIT